MMIVPEEDEDDFQYFDDDLRSMSSLSTVVELSEAEESMEGLLHEPESAISTESFTGFRCLSNPMGNLTGETTRDMAAGDSFADTMETEKEEPVAERDPDVDAFGRNLSKGRNNWFTSEYGSIFNLMDGQLQTREFTKPARKATTDIKYIKQLYTREFSLSELSVGEDTKRIGWGSFFKGDPDAWNLWNSEADLTTLTTLDVQRNVAAAVNSRRRMKWAIGVESNGMVTGVSLNEETKDILRQAIDFSLSREFVPELDPRVVKMDFMRVSAVTGDRYLVLLTIDSLLESLHQLSSGRIFYLVGDKILMAESINQIRLALEERMRHDGLVKEKGLGDGGKWMSRWTVVVGGLALSIGAFYAVKRWVK